MTMKCLYIHRCLGMEHLRCNVFTKLQYNVLIMIVNTLMTIIQYNKINNRQTVDPVVEPPVQTHTGTAWVLG